MFEIGTKVRVNALTGTIQDPDGSLGQPQKGYRPSYKAVWVRYDTPFLGSKSIYEHDDGSYSTRPGGMIYGTWLREEDVVLQK